MDIGEIARRSGVARSTVSYAISGKRPVSQQTRQRIQAVIDELGYRPNAVAKALKEGRTRTIALVIPPANTRLTDHQLTFVASVVNTAAKADLDVLLSPSGDEHDRSFERVITGRRVDGAILMEIRLTDHRVTRLQQTGLPFVTIGRTNTPDTTTWVDIDYDTLISRCVHHLADLGHQHIALIDRSPHLATTGYGPSHRAHTGFTRTTTQRGITPIHTHTHDNPNSGHTTTTQLLHTHPHLTAITTINEAALPGIYHAITQTGRTIGTHISITGVAAQHWAENLHPPLTAADAPADELATNAVNLLINRITNPTTPHQHLLLTPPISLRATTGPPHPFP
ncbi:LacI family DNA-binding transcriptional regulator [Microbispora sp. RL4-1S]|uniref:LacI family DNA-binding transcriptional regulator n=1 Tax=Microbispora oryzae TaxID=2806554 RepID=A0A940WWP0_9ACTN|nr:LacI family DNA-binding transcriptional regulator [Microbispora oryzae]MBP2708711.1 LacI family DNA-binding transcriptional regulator [Microbispora oryzae]